MNPVLVIYHANCLDGFGSAYSAYRYFQQQHIEDIQFYPASHGDEPPECTGKRVYILDFSYKRPLLKALCEDAEEVIIIDHHVSAMRDLEGLENEYDNLKVTFNMEKSGAVLSWEHFHQSPPPELLLHVQDLDLWNFALQDSRDVNVALESYPFEFSLWHDLVENSEKLLSIIQEGKAINRYLRRLIELYKRKAVMGEIAGYHVPIVNCPKAIASQLLHELAEGQPFAAGYQDKGTHRGWSLRSCEQGADVAKVAELFGGGGHTRAAGFRTYLPESLLKINAE